MQSNEQKAGTAAEKRDAADSLPSASLEQNCLLAEVKLTKSALNDFIKWSTSRYNNYCGYGTKKENVDIVYNSLIAGCYVDWHGRLDVSKKIFTIQCAGGVGENGNGRYWKTKSSGDEYTVNCETMTIEAKYSKRVIKFSSR